MTEHPERHVADIASAGADSLAEVAHDALDLALCMSVDPGWGAQQFLPASLDKPRGWRSALTAHVALEVDGGIHQGSIASAERARANVFVTGSGVFASDDRAAAYAAIVAALEARVRLDDMVEVARAAMRRRPHWEVAAEHLRPSPRSRIPEIDVSGKLPLSKRPCRRTRRRDERCSR
jgi:Ribulose-phosphate 3 epimerase family